MHGGSWDGVTGERGAADGSPVRPLIDFSVSVNAFGPAPVVLDALSRVAPDHYPDPRSTAARRAAAARWGRAPTEIAFGAGASELLQAIATAFVRRRDRVLVPAPAYGEYARAAALCGARVHTVAANDRHAMAIATLIDAVADARPRIVFVCAPNNPTGARVPRDVLSRLADACAASGALLVLDQSYDAFDAAPLGTPALPGHPAVLHLRSITKDHALAGVRAGFLVGPAPLIHAVERARAPWAASAYAQAAAEAALSDAGIAHVAETTARVRSERARLAETLRAAGVPTVASDTHLLLIEVGDASRVQRRLLAEHAIGVRDATSFGLPEHVRIAARTPAENDALAAALCAVMHRDAAPPASSPHRTLALPPATP
ncbi:MAG: histidinol-phosphate aminotransferase family protein [Gemmatimonadaceae bacterium]|nr:histidinol-phosphate aminotransferase family protein [Gemmatimonadaceae bacterium]